MYFLRMDLQEEVQLWSSPARGGRQLLQTVSQGGKWLLGEDARL